MSTPTGNTNLRSNCCETEAEFSGTYGCLPTGINPGNIAEGTEPISCLWTNIFGREGWWEQSGVEVINPYNRDQQAPRNCINFRKKCRPNNRISLAEKGDCCGAVCESVIRELDILKRVPKVSHKTVTVLGPTKMCKNSVSPPIPIRNLWALYIEQCDQTVPQSSLFRFQVSKNGHSWTTLSDDYLVTTVGVAPTENIYELIFNSDADGCGLNSNCLTCEGAPFAPDPNTSNPQTFPDTNAFFATKGIDGLPRLPCPPNYCFIRIVACTAFCLQSFTATYANGGGFCSSVPLCPAGLVYDDKVCRPNPIRSCPGLPSSGVTGYCDPTNPDAAFPAGPINGTPYRKHLHNSKINRKLFHVKDSHNAQLRQDESQHMRNVRALAGAPFNSRATNNGTSGLKFNPNAEGFLCASGCPEDIGVRCGEGCGPDGAPLPRPINCAVPARCRRPYATKHQTEDATLNKLVACAVAGCRKSGFASGASIGVTVLTLEQFQALNPGTVTYDGSVLTITGNTELPAHFKLISDNLPKIIIIDGSGTFTINGIIDIGPSIILNYGVINNNGRIKLSTNFDELDNFSIINNAGFIINNAGNIFNYALFNNTGQINNNTGGTITNNGMWTPNTSQGNVVNNGGILSPDPFP